MKICSATIARSGDVVADCVALTPLPTVTAGSDAVATDDVSGRDALSAEHPNSVASTTATATLRAFIGREIWPPQQVVVEFTQIALYPAPLLLLTQ